MFGTLRMCVFFKKFDLKSSKKFEIAKFVKKKLKNFGHKKISKFFYHPYIDVRHIMCLCVFFHHFFTFFSDLI